MTEVDMSKTMAPLPMLLWCPECGERHVDVCRGLSRARPAQMETQARREVGAVKCPCCEEEVEALEDYETESGVKLQICAWCVEAITFLDPECTCEDMVQDHQHCPVGRRRAQA